MHVPTVIIGAAAIVYGIVTTILRARKPDSFRKLDPMKERYGNRAGTTVHVVGYSLIPILFGALALVSGLSGRSVF